MAEQYDLIVRGGACVLPGVIAVADLGVSGGRIRAIGDLAGASAARVIRASGLHVLPGIVDSHVHLREPGFEHKEDLASGTKAALLGGVTCVVEMPNTDPPTTTRAALEQKQQRARGRVHCDIGFYVGATPDNIDTLPALESAPGCAGIKLFMGRSTGGLLVDRAEDLRRVLRCARRPVAIHAEDEARLIERRALLGSSPDVSQHPIWRDEDSALIATRIALELAAETGRSLHLLHVTTQAELSLLAKNRRWATVECTPQHLWLAAPECYEKLGTRAQMNPPIRSARHRDALWQAIAAGVVDVIGSDHAPHTLDEKARPYPDSPSGMPGVQTLLPLMLDAVSAGHLSLERMVELCATTPARILGLRHKGVLAMGADADLVLVDMTADQTIEDSAMASRCRWTPFAGRRVRGWPRMTVLRGAVAMEEGGLVGGAAGQVLEFRPPVDFARRET